MEFFYMQEKKLDALLTLKLVVEDPKCRIFSDIAMCLTDRVIFKTILDGGKDSHEDEIVFKTHGKIRCNEENKLFL